MVSRQSNFLKTIHSVHQFHNSNSNVKICLAFVWGRWDWAWGHFNSYLAGVSLNLHLLVLIYSKNYIDVDEFFLIMALIYLYFNAYKLNLRFYDKWTITQKTFPFLGNFWNFYFK